MKIPLKNYLTETEQKVLLFLIVFAVIGYGVQFSGLLAEEPVEKADSLDVSVDHQIKYDLQTVSEKELTTIPGIGPKRAADIVAYRREKGFKSNNDLINVKGIGEKTLAKIRKYFIGNSLSSEPEKIPKPPVKQNKTITSSTSKSEKININTATKNELITLKGIGPSKAEKIIVFRTENGKFQSIDELIKVKGIGTKTLEKLRDKLTLGE